MTIENVINWYEQNVNYKLTKSFLKFMIKTGIIKNDIDLDFLNLFLLEKENDKFVKNEGNFILKQNKIDIINNMPDKLEKEAYIKKDDKLNGNDKANEKKKKFKIEKLGGNKLKLVSFK